MIYMYYSLPIVRDVYLDNVKFAHSNALRSIQHLATFPSIDRPSLLLLCSVAEPFNSVELVQILSLLDENTDFGGASLQTASQLPLSNCHFRHRVNFN